MFVVGSLRVIRAFSRESRHCLTLINKLMAADQLAAVHITRIEADMQCAKITSNVDGPVGHQRNRFCIKLHCVGLTSLCTFVSYVLERETILFFL